MSIDLLGSTAPIHPRAVSFNPTCIWLRLAACHFIVCDIPPRPLNIHFETVFHMVSNSPVSSAASVYIGLTIAELLLMPYDWMLHNERISEPHASLYSRI